MKFRCCKYLLSGLAFFPDRVKCCNQVKIGPPLVSDLKNLTAKKIESARKKIIEDCKNGIYPECCADCEYFVEGDWVYTGIIDYMAFFHWIHCNCGCIYCLNQFDTKGKFSDDVKPANYSITNALSHYKYDNLKVEFGGGEPVLLEEFPEIADIISNSHLRSCYLMSSGITYSKHIAKLLKKNYKTTLSITISAGNSKTFEKVKRRNKFSAVKNNIKKYLKSAKALEQVIIRYLIVDGVNDNEEDILDWLNMLKELNIIQNELTIEFCLALHFKKGKKLSEKLYKLVDFYKNSAEELGLTPRVDDVAVKILERGYY